jgi:hypothetical protein
MRHVFKRISTVALLSLLVLSGLVQSPQKASAAYAPDFQAGNIIGDSLFFDGGTMNADQIQQFLSNMVPNCDTNGTQTSEYGGGTRAQYGASRGYPAPYICLRNYIENPTTHANNLGGVAPSGGWSAAQIISNAAITYGVSPKVLLVTLQKESTLVNDTWPFPSQYKTAMGYGCPDSAPCDSQYYGFYNQVMNAARQFHQYATTPASYRYKAGQNNAILYSPSASCSSGTVFVQDQATAGLYNYTPYQPNSAALNNLYGSGDACSSYGNRNFWRLYTDWFGSTTGSDLVRTVNDGTVYLISGSNKYPIADQNVLSDFSALGHQVTFVSDAFMNNHTAGPLLGHMVGSPGGTIYFVDAGIKLPFTSCQQVADYGYSCSAVNYLTDGQLGNLASGPAMTSLYQTTTGKEFYISGGTKREVFDQQSLTSAGVSDGVNTLLEGGLAYLPYGAPVIRSDVVAMDRDTSQGYLYSNGVYYSLSGTGNLNSLSSLPKAWLDDPSIPSSIRSTSFSGFVTDPTGTNDYILVSSGKVLITNPTSWNVTYATVSTNLLSALPNATDPINNMLVKSPTDATVYYVAGGQKRPVPSWNDLLGLQVSPLAINTILSSELNAIPAGRVIYAPGQMVKSSSSSTIYITKNDTTLMPISSFIYPSELGVNFSIVTLSNADFAAYTVAGLVQTKVVCGGQDYIGINGKLYPFNSTALTTFGFSQSDFVDMGTACANLPTSTQPVGGFIRINNGTIYLIQNGQKQAFTNYNAYIAHGGNGTNTTQVTDYFAGLISAGSNIIQ